MEKTAQALAERPIEVVGQNGQVLVPTGPDVIKRKAIESITRSSVEAGHPTTAEQVAGTEAEVHLENIRREVPGTDVIGDIAHDASRFIGSMTEGSGYIDAAKPDAKGNATVIKRFWEKAKAAGRSTKKGLFSFTLKGKNS